MNKRNNRRRHNNEDIKQKKVIRCKILNKPVFEHEVCSRFNSKVNLNNQNNCGNCKYSF